jgi:hypothetical protein
VVYARIDGSSDIHMRPQQTLLTIEALQLSRTLARVEEGQSQHFTSARSSPRKLSLAAC